MNAVLTVEFVKRCFGGRGGILMADDFDRQGPFSPSRYRRYDDHHRCYPGRGYQTALRARISSIEAAPAGKTGRIASRTECAGGAINRPRALRKLPRHPS